MIIFRLWRNGKDRERVIVGNTYDALKMVDMYPNFYSLYGPPEETRVDDEEEEYSSKKKNRRQYN